MSDLGWWEIAAITLTWNTFKISAILFLPIRYRKRLIAWARHWSRATAFAIARMA